MRKWYFINGILFFYIYKNQLFKTGFFLLINRQKSPD